MQKVLSVAAVAAAALLAAASVTANAQVASGPSRYIVTNHNARSVTHYRRAPRFYAARPGDFITNFSSSEHVAVNHPPKNR